MNFTKYGKTIENLINRINLKKERTRLSKQRKRLFKMYIKTRIYVTQNIWQ